MFEIAREVLRELRAGGRLGVVVVTSVHGSAPRTVGSAMAVTEDGRAIGSISGGCVESEAYELAGACLASGEAIATTLGGEGDVLAAGLACGGSLGVLALRLGDGGPDDASVTAALEAALDDERLGEDLVLELAGPGAAVRLVRPAAPRMVVVGAVDFSGALASAARLLGYRVTVCDPRGTFATRERFPAAHEVAVEWPDVHLGRLTLGVGDAVCVLTHEERFDVPALTAALASGAGYVGVMGSRRTHDRRVAALRAAGVGDEELARLRSPIGLDLGGSSPAETAVAIVAEILAARTGASGLPLSGTRGPIHRRAER